MTALVDSSVWIDFFKGVSNRQGDLLEQLVTQGTVILGDLIVCEVLQGIRDPEEFETAREHLLTFPVYSLVGVEIAIKSAVYYRQLRERGHTIRKTIDCLIATFCIEHNLPLLHNDRDFDVFQGELGLNTP